MSEETNIYGKDIHFAETDTAVIYNTIITSLEENAGEPLYPGDERRIFSEGLVPVFAALYSSIDDAARQTLLRYARGEVLDAIGERLDVTRLESASAKTTLRFSVSAPQAGNIIIPQGTRATPDGSVCFATDEIAVLQAGNFSVDVPASASQTGAAYNGYVPGAIATLVDLIPYIASVTNTETSSGGDDGEPYTTDGDDRYRERIRIAPAKRSTAGPEQAYIYWTMSADSSIVDARAVSETETIRRTLKVYGGTAFLGGATLLPQTLTVKNHENGTAAAPSDYTAVYQNELLAITVKGALADAESLDIEIDRTLEGYVKIIPLLEGGMIPDEAMLQKIRDVVDAPEIRPMGDKILVVAPEQVIYDIEITYYTTPETEAEVIANVEGTGGAIERYNAWQVGALGRDVNPDQLRRRILSPSWGENLSGAYRVDVVQPEYAELNDSQVAKFSGRLIVSHKIGNEAID